MLDPVPTTTWRSVARRKMTDKARSEPKEREETYETEIGRFLLPPVVPLREAVSRSSSL